VARRFGFDEEGKEMRGVSKRSRNRLWTAALLATVWTAAFGGSAASGSFDCGVP